MKLTLTDALHARPANLLVRVANDFDATITLMKGARVANAKSILEVLGLGAAKGDELTLLCEGNDAELARRTIAELNEGNFSSDLVPEKGAASVPGIAIGRAHVLEPGSVAATVTDATARFRDVRHALERDLMLLSPEERELFEPELAILQELEPRVQARMEQGAQSFRDAVDAETTGTMTDLFLDARARLLGESLRLDVGTEEGPAILVASSLPPSLVASLPAAVVGIVSAKSEEEAKHGTGNTSHAAIIARSRGIALAFVGSEVTDAIAHHDEIILDTTESSARVWIEPSPELREQAMKRRDARVAEEDAQAARAAELAANARVVVRVNVSRIDESLPREARGVGLTRTELLFAAYRAEPTLEDQAAAYRAIVARAAGHPVVIRLFDAGGDKPLPWLPCADPDVRGAALLFMHEDVLRRQLQAIADARANGDARVLIPLTRTAHDVERVRALCPPGVPIGAMLETKEAIEQADQIARAADFLSIGTNDLTASVLGIARADASLGLSAAVLEAIARAIAAARAHEKEISVCGELAAHSEGAPRLVAAGVTALSVAIPAFARVITLVSEPVTERGKP